MEPLARRGQRRSRLRAGQAWLQRFFDQICFYPVSEEELLRIRRDFPAGRYPLRIEHGSFSLRSYRDFLQANAGDIGAFKLRQQAAFDAERERWRAAGQADHIGEPEIDDAAASGDPVPLHARIVANPVPGSVWKVLAAEGDEVGEGDTLLIVDSIKMEFAVTAPCAGRVWRVSCGETSAVSAGQEVAVIQPLPAEL